jgi:DNA-binding XRE family transcriptional regulator
MSIVTEGWAVTGQDAEIIGHLRGWIEAGWAEAIRKAARLDRVALGVLLGVEWQTAQRVEDGREIPSVEIQRRYARLLRALYPLFAKENA